MELEGKPMIGLNPIYQITDRKQVVSINGFNSDLKKIKTCL